MERACHNADENLEQSNISDRHVIGPKPGHYRMIGSQRVQDQLHVANYARDP